MMRPIGRRESEPSPTRRLLKGCAARMPARRRMVVPELPQLIGSVGAVSLRLLPCTIKTSGSGCSILIPSACIARTVFRQSALGEKPRKTHGPLASEATMTARCEMLLSPVTVISASMRGARFIRRSSMKAKSAACQLSVGRGEESQVADKCPAVAFEAKPVQARNPRFRKNQLVRGRERFYSCRDRALPCPAESRARRRSPD